MSVVLTILLGIACDGCIDFTLHGTDAGDGKTEEVGDSISQTDGDIDTDTDTDEDSAFGSETSGAADFEQADDESGLVVIEAEHYSQLKTAADESAWDTIFEPEGYSGTGAMQAVPDAYLKHGVQAFAQENAPVLKYNIRFTRIEPVYIWLRASHADAYSDSVWFGQDGTIVGTSPIVFNGVEQQIVNQWYYIGYTMDKDRTVMDIDGVGVKTFELYMREPNFRIDRIVLTIDPNLDPNLQQP